MVSFVKLQVSRKKSLVTQIVILVPIPSPLMKTTHTRVFHDCLLSRRKEVL